MADMSGYYNRLARMTNVRDRRDLSKIEKQFEKLKNEKVHQYERVEKEMRQMLSRLSAEQEESREELEIIRRANQEMESEHHPPTLLLSDPASSTTNAAKRNHLPTKKSSKKLFRASEVTLGSKQPALDAHQVASRLLEHHLQSISKKKKNPKKKTQKNEPIEALTATASTYSVKKRPEVHISIPGNLKLSCGGPEDGIGSSDRETRASQGGKRAAGTQARADDDAEAIQAVTEASTSTQGVGHGTDTHSKLALVDRQPTTNPRALKPAGSGQRQSELCLPVLKKPSQKQPSEAAGTFTSAKQGPALEPPSRGMTRRSSYAADMYISNRLKRRSSMLPTGLGTLKEQQATSVKGGTGQPLMPTGRRASMPSTFTTFPDEELDLDALRRYYDLLATSNPLSEQDRRLGSVGSKLSTYKRSQKRKILALEAVLQQLPSFQKRKQEMMHPQEALNCRYLRLPARVIRQLEQCCEDEGVDVSMHAHLTEQEVLDRFERNDRCASLSSTDTLPGRCSSGSDRLC